MSGAIVLRLPSRLEYCVFVCVCVSWHFENTLPKLVTGVASFIIIIYEKIRAIVQRTAERFARDTRRRSTSYRVDFALGRERDMSLGARRYF